MLTFKQFLNEASPRSKKIDVEAFMSWCDDNASEFLSSGKLIYRGVSGNSDSGFVLGDSMLGEPRKSMGTSNNYTLWMDNHRGFGYLPKRSRSFICTSRYSDAKFFGHVSIVIPSDRTDIGIVGKDDIWDISIGYGIIFKDLSDMAKNAFHDVLKTDSAPETYDELRKNLSNVTKIAIEKALESGDNLKDSQMLKKILHIMDDTRSDNLYEVWNQLVTSKYFGDSSGRTIGRRDFTGEIWIQGTCAFMFFESTGISDDDLSKLKEWAREKYPAFYRHIKDFKRGDGDEFAGPED